jgi:hypothetical protein
LTPVFPIFRLYYREASFTQHRRDIRAKRLLILNNQNCPRLEWLPAALQELPLSPSGPSINASRFGEQGRNTWKVVPRPGAFKTFIIPPCARTTPCATARPVPGPGFVVRRDRRSWP